MMTKTLSDDFVRSAMHRSFASLRMTRTTCPAHAMTETHGWGFEFWLVTLGYFTCEDRGRRPMEHCQGRLSRELSPVQIMAFKSLQINHLLELLKISNEVALEGQKPCK